MPQSTLKEKYAALRRVDIRCGNSFKGIKKFALFYQDGQVEIKSNAVPKQKERYFQKLCLPKELSNLQADLLALQTENWQNRYVGASSLDYDEWQVSFLFSDGEELFYQGVNAYPPNWAEVEVLVQKYAGLCLTDDEEKDDA